MDIDAREVLQFDEYQAFTLWALRYGSLSLDGLATLYFAERGMTRDPVDYDARTAAWHALGTALQELIRKGLVETGPFEPYGWTRYYRVGGAK